ncbi:MAG: DMT family transporter [Lentimicrobiaceae bacterium]|nr:DMT family transporter [Lentimicrobiaceae bacterium]
MKIKKEIIIGGVAVSLAATLWGLDGIVLTPRLRNLDIGFVVFMVHCIPFLVMNVFLFREYKHLKSFTTSDFITTSLVALFGGALGTLAIVKALFLMNFQSLTIVVLLQKMQPVFAIILAVVLLREKLQKNYLLWATIAILAGYFLTFGFALPNLSTGSNTVYAALYALLAAFSFGSSTVLSKKLLNRLSFTTATFYRYGFTVVFMGIFVAFTGKFSQIAIVTPANWLIFFIIGITTGSGAIFLFYFGLRKIKAMLATICELFFPMSAIVFDYIFNQSRLSWEQWIGAVAMIFAIVRLNMSE